jgi:hypothetical protein
MGAKHGLMAPGPKLKQNRGFAELASCSCMAPIMLNVIIIVAAANAIGAIFEVVVFWIRPDNGLFSIKQKI